MPPRQVLLMRHAEKSGDPKDPDLTDAGRLRANRLAAYIPATFGKPDYLFATAISKHSARPIETITPLSDKIGVDINSDYADQDYGALASDLLTDKKFDNRLIVVCWHHGNIPSLARALRAKAGTYPNPWDAGTFNQILAFSFTGDGRPEVVAMTEPF